MRSTPVPTVTAVRRSPMRLAALVALFVGCAGGGSTDGDDSDADGDETDDVTPTCGDNASPTDAGCACDEGWVADGELCTDVDECATGSPCAEQPDRSCVNLEGGYTCDCTRGTRDEDGACVPDWTQVATYVTPTLVDVAPRVAGLGDRVYVAQREFASIAPTFLSVDVVTGTVTAEVAPTTESNRFCRCGYTASLAGVGGSVFVFGNDGGRYDVGARTWSDVSYPEAFQHGESAVVELDGYLYVVGGRDSGDSKRVDRYDPITDTWESATTLPVAASWGAAAVLDGRIHVAVPDPEVGERTQLLSWAPGDTAWTSLASLDTGFDRSVLVATGNGLWLGHRSWMWRYDAAADAWSGEIPVPAIDALVGVGGELVLVEAYRGGVPARVLRYDGE